MSGRSAHASRFIRAATTRRVLRAMENPYFTILAHPTGRVIGTRAACELDMLRVLRQARENGCFLELNAHPDRLDLLDVHCQLARDEGVLVFASGGATHNLRELSYHRGDPVPQPWVAEFNEWLADAVMAGRREELIGYRRKAPHAVRNHPTDEHLIPLYVALGAGGPAGVPKRLHTSISSGVISMDAYRFD